MSNYPSRAAAFEAGRRVGAKEERERLASGRQQSHNEETSPPPLTLDRIRRGEIPMDELIERKPEVDRLLAEEGSE